MGQKCVLWAKPVLVTLTIIFAAGLQWSNANLSAQSSPDPSTLPRLAFADFTYMGGFRLPRTAQGGDFSYGGLNLAYNPARNSLFADSLHQKVAEVTIPAPVNTTDVNQMPFAAYLQGFSDPSEGHFREVEQGGPNGAVMAGLLVHGNRLYATGSIYYDAQNSQVVSHFSHSTNLSEPSFLGMSQVWETGKAGYVGGYMASIPSEWQSLLGGPALTGQCCIPIVTRTSYGPAAFGFNPAGIGANTAVPAAPLLYYPSNHTTLGPWEGANSVYGATTSMGGAAVIAGTRTALFIGRNGMGTYCYGHGVSDPALGGTKAADGQLNCYDPASSDKGMHAYPYRYQIWAYDLADFAAVKSGTKQPWEIVPYAVWPFDFPTSGRTVRIGGVAYDAQRQLLYIAQYRADTDGYAERSIIHTLKINVPSSTAPPPPSTTVSLAPDAAAPKAPGTLIRWSAAAAGGTAPYEYKWASYASGTWSVLRDWSASATFDWQPTTAAPDARMAVWVRTAPGTPSSGDISINSIAAVAEYPFAIVDATPGESPAPPSAISSVTLTTNLVAPQPAASTIVWTATPAGGSGALVYKWFVTNDGLTWNAIGSWTSSNQFSWTPTVAGPTYRVSAWVKHASNPKDEWEASSERPFAITAATPTSPVASVALTTNVASPQPAGSTIVWTATPTGGTGALVYKWYVSNDGASWSTNGLWTASNQFTWTPAVANANSRVSVWVKRASNPKDEWEATSERQFAIIEPASVSTPVASVALTTNVASPQPAGSTIVWTATPTGGTGALVYKWFVSNDGASWSTNGLWSASNQFAWTPAVANANSRVSVWVKRASNPKDEWEATSERPFAIAEPSVPVASLTLTTSLPAPQPAGSTIVWTATPTGGTGALVYKWFVNDGMSWNAIGSWTSSNQFTWTPTAANANHRVSAWVKRASNPKDEWEATSERPFPITEPSFPVASVALTTNLPAPQPAGSTIVWTATPTGGTGALVYRWFVNDGVSWNAIGSWTASNQFTWTPTVANANYRVSAWVKRASNPKDEWEATSEAPFAISEPSYPVASVALGTDVPAPQEVSSTIVWTATPTGGTGPLVFKWFVTSDGATWNAVGTWTSSNQFTWTPTEASANYGVSVWVKRASNPVDGAEASADQLFAIQEPVTSVALTTNLASPQPLSSTIEWTATPTGGASDALVYKWFISHDDGATWTAAGPWNLSNRMNWTPTAVNPKYRVTVWVKHATDPSDYPEASAQRRFAIKK